MKNPKSNFTIIPNWLADEFQTVKEFKAFIKMYNGWCLMKDADGWYYRSKSKLKEDFGMNPTCSDTRVTQLTRRFEELGILQIKSEGKKANWYKFNEEFMFNHEEDTTDEGKVQDVPKHDNDRYKTYLRTKVQDVPNREVQDVPKQDRYKTYLQYNTNIIKDKKNNTVQYNTCTIVNKEKKDKEKKEISGQGLSTSDGVSFSSLTNEGDNFIQSEGERDRQCIDVTVSLSSKSNKKKDKSNTSKDLKDSQNTGLSHNPPSALATPLGVSDSEPHPQVPLTPSPTDTPKRSYGDVYWQVRKMIEKGKGFSEQKVRDYVYRYFIQTGKVTQHEFEGDMAELQMLRDTLHPTEKRSERLEISAADLDNCALSDDNLPNEQEYQNIEKCRQEAPYAILSNSGHLFTSEPMVMYGT